MPNISLTYETDVHVVPRAERRAAFLYALSGVMMVAGSALITLAALIKWWPVSGIVLAVSAVVFWTYVNFTAKDEAEI